MGKVPKVRSLFFSDRYARRRHRRTFRSTEISYTPLKRLICTINQLTKQYLQSHLYMTLGRV
ncbi:MAG: hypothetical protein ACYT04_81395, partial [Nostoc sp.]